MYGLVFWLKEKRTSIVDVDWIFEEDRHPGRIAQVLWGDGHRHTAQVVKIAKSKDTLEEADTKFMEAYSNLGSKTPSTSAEGTSSKRVTRKAQKTPQQTRTATAAQVARALGEKPPLSTSQANVKSVAKRQERAVKANTNQTEKSLDILAMKSASVFDSDYTKSNSESKNSAKQKLDFGPSGPAPKIKKVAPGTSSTEEKESSPSPESSPIVSQLATNSLSGSSGNESSESDGECREDAQVSNNSQVSGSCSRCKALVSCVNPSSVKLVSSLVKFCGLEQEENHNENCNEDDNRVKYLKPLPVTPGLKQVELTPGSGIFIAKSTKAKIVVNAANDPYKLTREVTTALFGDQLKKKGLSAMGYGEAKEGIDEVDLLNIYNFVTRNSNTQNPPGLTKTGKNKQPCTYSNFIREVNKKLKSKSRTRKSSKPSEGQSQKTIPTSRQQQIPPSTIHHQQLSSASPQVFGCRDQGNHVGSPSSASQQQDHQLRSPQPSAAHQQTHQFGPPQTSAPYQWGHQLGSLQIHAAHQHGNQFGPPQTSASYHHSNQVGPLQTSATFSQGHQFGSPHSNAAYQQGTQFGPPQTNPELQGHQFGSPQTNAAHQHSNQVGPPQINAADLQGHQFIPPQTNAGPAHQHINHFEHANGAPHHTQKDSPLPDCQNVARSPEKWNWKSPQKNNNLKTAAVTCAGTPSKAWQVVQQSSTYQDSAPYQDASQNIGTLLVDTHTLMNL